jgi:hypothetical protein
LNGVRGLGRRTEAVLPGAIKEVAQRNQSE